MVLFYSSSSADLNSFEDLPNDFANSGSLFAPNSSNKIAKIINNSVGLNPPNIKLFYHTDT